jgi:hypothetical protein
MAELQNGPISGYDVIAVNKKRIFNFGGRPAPH